MAPAGGASATTPMPAGGPGTANESGRARARHPLPIRAKRRATRVHDADAPAAAYGTRPRPTERFVGKLAGSGIPIRSEYKSWLVLCPHVERKRPLCGTAKAKASQTVEKEEGAVISLAAPRVQEECAASGREVPSRSKHKHSDSKSTVDSGLGSSLPSLISVRGGVDGSPPLSPRMQRHEAQGEPVNAGRANEDDFILPQPTSERYTSRLTTRRRPIPSCDSRQNVPAPESPSCHPDVKPEIIDDRSSSESSPEMHPRPSRTSPSRYKLARTLCEAVLDETLCTPLALLESEDDVIELANDFVSQIVGVARSSSVYRGYLPFVDDHGTPCADLDGGSGDSSSASNSGGQALSKSGSLSSSQSGPLKRTRRGRGGPGDDGSEDRSDDESDDRRKKNKGGARSPGNKGPDPDAPYPCPFRKRSPTKFVAREFADCAHKSFPDLASLKRHLASKHYVPKKPFECPRCRAQFDTRAEWDEHLNRPREDMCERQALPPAQAAGDDLSPYMSEQARNLLGARDKGKLDSWDKIWEALFPRVPAASPAFQPVVELDEVTQAFERQYPLIRCSLDNDLRTSLSPDVYKLFREVCADVTSNLEQRIKGILAKCADIPRLGADAVICSPAYECEAQVSCQGFEQQAQHPLLDESQWVTTEQPLTDQVQGLDDLDFSGSSWMDEHFGNIGSAEPTLDLPMQPATCQLPGQAAFQSPDQAIYAGNEQSTTCTLNPAELTVTRVNIPAPSPTLPRTNPPVAGKHRHMPAVLDSPQARSALSASQLHESLARQHYLTQQARGQSPGHVSRPVGPHSTSSPALRSPGSVSGASTAGDRDSFAESWLSRRSSRTSLRLSTDSPLSRSSSGRHSSSQKLGPSPLARRAEARSQSFFEVSDDEE